MFHCHSIMPQAGDQASTHGPLGALWILLGHCIPTIHTLCPLTLIKVHLLAQNDKPIISICGDLANASLRFLSVTTSTTAFVPGPLSHEIWGLSHGNIGSGECHCGVFSGERLENSPLVGCCTQFPSLLFFTRGHPQSQQVQSRTLGLEVFLEPGSLPTVLSWPRAPGAAHI